MDKINFIIYYKNSIEKNLHDPERVSKNGQWSFKVSGNSHNTFQFSA